MENLSQPEMLKIVLLAGAFFVGVGVCAYVVIKDSIELNKRREAKRLMYEDEVKRELQRRQEMRARAQQDQEKKFQTFAL